MNNDLFAVTTFDDTMLGIVEHCETTNVTTFPDIIDDTGHAYSASTAPWPTRWTRPATM